MNYSLTELEILGLCVNNSQVIHFFAKVDFDCTIGYLTLTYIMKSKTEQSSQRIKRLLEVHSVYSFNLYSMKGKDMIFSDFLSRMKVGKLNPHEIIPISFDLQEVRQESTTFRPGLEHRKQVLL